MKKSLLFLPDISGFTNFIQTTEAAHSQHVISELLEVLIGANTQNLQLAEVEGDALFFYLEEEVPSLEKLLAQIESMFTAFYSHLKLLEKNRICPCTACSSAPQLQLKIIAHIGELQFITVQGKRKPFGAQVIEAHRLMKNSVQSDNYTLVSRALADHIELPIDYQSKLFKFSDGVNEYDGKPLEYVYSIIETSELKLKPFAQAKKMTFDRSPNFTFKKEFPVSAPILLEYITNYAHRHLWQQGVDEVVFNENEVTRVGTEHMCVVGGKQLNFITVTKDGDPGQLVYGELSTSPPPVDEIYLFFIINPQTESTCELELEVYYTAKSPIKKLMLAVFAKNFIRKNAQDVISQLHGFISSLN